MLLLLKVLLAPALVVLSSLAARRWGARAGGILVTIPIVAGPILLIIYLDHGAVFAARAATAATAGCIALAVFALVLILTVDRLAWWLAVLVTWVCVLVVDLGLSLVVMPAVAALVVALIALHGVQRVLRRQVVLTVVAPTAPWWDLPARAVATAGLVLLVTGSAAAVGPWLSGVLAPFPIALSVVCAFAAAQTGRGGVIALLRGIVPGLDGFVLFCFTVAETVDRLPGWASFIIATTVNLVLAGVLIMVGDRRGRRAGGNTPPTPV